jgi:hypothetical protein
MKEGKNGSYGIFNLLRLKWLGACSESREMDNLRCQFLYILEIRSSCEASLSYIAINTATGYILAVGKRLL